MGGFPVPSACPRRSTGAKGRGASAVFFACRNNRGGLSLFFLGLVLGLVSHSLHANPVGPTVSQGKASFTSQGPQYTIQTSDHAFINWQSFNIGVGETTTFIQPSS